MTIEEVQELKKEYEKVISGMVEDFQHRTGLEVTGVKFESQVRTMYTMLEFGGDDQVVELAPPKINMEVRV